MGIRANSAADIAAIKMVVSLPVIGILKRDYPDSKVFITATMLEVHEIMQSQPDMIALDATDRPRPNGESLSALVAAVREQYPQVLLMADVATVDEAKNAERLKFDCVSSTLFGYTAATAGHLLPDDDFAQLRAMRAVIRCPLIAEGNVDTPERAAQALKAGADAVVVGGAITRPQLITRRFASALSM
ncbi:N-acetylmannosamine-6-phosphate 2-epimerase [Iodobacter ciconiae]|uniref:N-acetylmannosamine-6-phosphate 2-epimerase n=1 Tax=Iodobacter ciconiae TaxID=2496266 RepID=UPI0019D0AFBF|nr:N-acetylmannosamine-6-phosphate 2-epimerase [Iodobacter ciconiae]